jgi:hypothetical protein
MRTLMSELARPLARMYGKPRAGITAHRLYLLDPRCSVALDNDHARTSGLVFGVRNSEELLAWANSMVRADDAARLLGPRLPMDVAPGHPKKPAHAHDGSCAPNRRAGNDARQILATAEEPAAGRGNLAPHLRSTGRESCDLTLSGEPGVRPSTQSCGSPSCALVP